MLTTIAENEEDKADSELRCYFTGAVEGLWQEHPCSALDNNPLTGRNGGLLYFEEQVYRVSQTPGFQHYGEACKIWEILSSSGVLHFKFIQDVNPKFSKNIKSIHHFHGTDLSFVFDFEIRK